MKIFASVVALVLVGLTGGWLWMDATAQARQETDGIVITGAVDPATASGLLNAAQPGAQDAGPGAPSSAGRPASLDEVVTLLASSSQALVERADEARQAEKAAADKKAADDRSGEQPATPIPVQPAPVTPSGCEWDDDHAEWDCDDDGGDDDDWDDWDDDHGGDDR